MRVAHFDCFSGISGDMVLGAVIDAGVPADAIRAALDSLGLPIKLEVERVKRCGFAATKATVEAADQEDYRFLPDVEAILAKGALTPKQRELATTIFRKVAVAESTVHGMPLEKVPASTKSGKAARQHRRHRGRRGRSGLTWRGEVHQHAGPDRQRDGEVRSRDHARAYTRHRGVAQRRAARLFADQNGTHHPHRRRDSHDRRERVHRDSYHDHRTHRARLRHEGLP